MTGSLISSAAEDHRGLRPHPARIDLLADDAVVVQAAAIEPGVEISPPRSADLPRAIVYTDVRNKMTVAIDDAAPAPQLGSRSRAEVVGA